MTLEDISTIHLLIVNMLCYHKSVNWLSITFADIGKSVPKIWCYTPVLSTHFILVRVQSLFQEGSNTPQMGCQSITHIHTFTPRVNLSYPIHLLVCCWEAEGNQTGRKKAKCKIPQRQQPELRIELETLEI